MLFTHILASLTVGFIFRWWKNRKNLKRISKENSVNTTLSFKNLGEILSTSIISSIKTIVLIGGFIILFSVIISIIKTTGILNIFSPLINSLKIPMQYFNGIFFGLLELTNGLNIITSIANKSLSTNIIICAFLLGFGGFSILLQVLSIISKNKIPIKSYFIGKLLHGFIAATYVFLILKYIPIFNLDL